MAAKFPFNEILKLENIQTLPFGGIIIDVDQERGSNIPTHPKKYNMSLKDHIELFPLGMSENNSVKGSGLLFSKMWFTGSCKPVAGDLSIRDLDKGISDWMNLHSICSFSQKIGTRSESQLNSLFGCFKMYGGNNRFSPKNRIDDTKFDDMVKKGVVLKEWKESPIPIKFALRSLKTKHNLDFLFLIGGSDIICRKDKLDDLKYELQKGFEHIRDFFKSGDADEMKLCNYFIRNEGVWSAYDDVPELEQLDGQEKSYAKLMRSYFRTMVGVIYIRNFMLYAKNILGEQSFDVLEFNDTGYKEIDADKVINYYDDIYNYIRNVIILTDLA